MTGFTENIQKITGVEVEKDDEGYAVLAVSVVTRGGITKTLRIPHYWADLLRMWLESGISDMDTDYRRSSWWISAPGTVERKTEMLGEKPA